MSFSKAHCEEILRFHQWRQQKVITLLTGIPEQILHKPLGGSFKSIHLIVKHLVWAEQIWISRVQGLNVPAFEELPDTPGAIYELWQTLTAQWNSHLSKSSESAFSETINFGDESDAPFQNELGEIFIHLMDHATYHIGQVMDRLREMNINPVRTNYIHYLNREKLGI